MIDELKLLQDEYGDKEISLIGMNKKVIYIITLMMSA